MWLDVGRCWMGLRSGRALRRPVNFFQTKLKKKINKIFLDLALYTAHIMLKQKQLKHPATNWALSHASFGYTYIRERSTWYSVINQWNYRELWDRIFSRTAVDDVCCFKTWKWPVTVRSRSGRLVEAVMARNGGQITQGLYLQRHIRWLSLQLFFMGHSTLLLKLSVREE